jgi:hypothetical protein
MTSARVLAGAGLFLAVLSSGAAAREMASLVREIREVERTVTTAIKSDNQAELGRQRIRLLKLIPQIRSATEIKESVRSSCALAAATLVNITSAFDLSSTAGATLGALGDDEREYLRLMSNCEKSAVAAAATAAKRRARAAAAAQQPLPINPDASLPPPPGTLGLEGR